MVLNIMLTLGPIGIVCLLVGVVLFYKFEFSASILLIIGVILTSVSVLFVFK